MTNRPESVFSTRRAREAFTHIPMIAEINVRKKRQLTNCDIAIIWTRCYDMHALMNKCVRFVTGAHMGKSTADSILNLIHRKGVLRPRDLDAYEIPREHLARLHKRGLVTRVGRGLYVDVNADLSAQHTLAEVCRRVPGGVVCLISALRFHGLTTQMPFQVWLAISRTMREPKEPLLPIRTVRMTDRSFTAGIEKHNIDGVKVNVYSPAKTIADCFKFRNKIGLDVALDALRDFLAEGKCNQDELWRFAKICRQTNVMKPYLETIS
jgi:hypothetical protein